MQWSTVACAFLASYVCGSLVAYVSNNRHRHAAYTAPPQTLPLAHAQRFPRHVFLYSTGAVLQKKANGYKLRVFDEQSARDYIVANCPRLVITYDTLVPKSFKSDTFRVCALYTEGGVYVDDDVVLSDDYFELLESSPRGGALLVDDKDVDYTAGFLYLTWRYTRDWDVCNAIMAFRFPHHPLLACAMDRIIDNVRRRRVDLNSLQITGPGAIGYCMDSGADVVYAGKLLQTSDKSPNAVVLGYNAEVLARHYKVNRTFSHYSKFDSAFDWYASSPPPPKTTP